MDKLKYLQDANKLNELISLELNKFINKKISNEITPKQHLCLIYIGNSKIVTAGKIGNILDISKSSTSQLLNRLEKKELIKREINNKNKNEVNVSLDYEGQLYFNKYLDIKKTVLLDFFSFLDEDEIKILFDINNKVLMHIRRKNDF
ncbi:MAG: MarR family transcriptional regulator [bacterium]|nr:MarR family transcriptional regulator [bacterium]